jgi:hypothetical protein
MGFPPGSDDKKRPLAAARCYRYLHEVCQNGALCNRLIYNAFIFCDRGSSHHIGALAIICAPL